MKKLLAHLSTYFAAAACAETGAVDMAMQLLGETPAGNGKRHEKRKRLLRGRTVLNLR